MFGKVKSIHLTIIKMQMLIALMVSISFFIGLQLFLMLVESTGITLLIIVYLTLFVFVLSLLIGVYVSYSNSIYFKKRLEDILTFIATLTRGKLSERMSSKENDEIGRISIELNQLASKIQNHVNSLQRLADEKASLAEQAHAAATIEERQRLARDLHDAVSQQLFALSMMSSAAIRLLDSNVDKAREQMEDIADIAGKAQGEMRALLLHLRPVHLSNDNLIEGILKLVQELSSKTGIFFETKIDDLEGLSKGTENHLFRIIQEALSNILRHSESTRVKLEVLQKERYVLLFIGDNGNGFDIKAEKIASYGLQTMRERCEELGGTFQLRSKPNEGTYINIRIPTSDREEKEDGRDD